MSTLSRGDEIEWDFYELKSQELGPVASWGQIRTSIEAAIASLSYTGSGTTELGVPEIVVTNVDVVICGVRVPRPPSIAPSQWLAFWTGAVAGGTANVRAESKPRGR